MPVIEITRPNTLEKPQPVGRSNASPFKFFSKVFELLLALTIVILALETCFWITGIGEQEFLRIDKEFGFVPFENKRITWRKEGYSRFHFNSFGMQDREYKIAKPPNTIRIAVIGDSYIEAMQVDRKLNFCSLLEQHLNKTHPEKSFQVMNFGVSAYNMAQSYLRFKNLALKFQPDFFILPLQSDACHYLQPKLNEGFYWARPNFFVDHNGKLIKDHTVQNIWLKSWNGKRMQSTSWLRRNSHIYGTISKAMEPLMTWKQSGGLLAPFIHNGHKVKTGFHKDQTEEVINPEKDKSTVFLWRVADALLQEMDNECKANNCQFLVVRMPQFWGYFNSKEDQLLKQSTARIGIDYIDISRLFTEPIKENARSPIIMALLKFKWVGIVTCVD